MKEDIVSIIMPTFNRVEMIQNSIKSVILQTYTNWELLIIDDGSIDDTEKVIKNLNDKRIKYYRLKKNHGRNYARKYGVEKSQGNFITFLDSDDTIHKDKLYKQKKRLQLNPYADIVLCNYNEIRYNNIIQHDLSKYSSNSLENLLISPGPVIHSMLINCKRIDNLSKYMIDVINEWDFLINLAKKGLCFICQNEILADWNVHKHSISENPKIEAKNFQLIIKKHRKLILKSVGKNVLSDHYRTVARLWENANNLKKAKKYYKKAFFTSRFNIKNISYYMLTNLGYSNILFKIINLIRKYKKKTWTKRL